MLDLEVSYISFVEKVKSTKFLCSALSLILFLDLCFVLTIQESIIAVRAGSVKAVALNEIFLFVLAYLVLEGYVIPALYNWYTMITLLVKGRGFTLITGVFGEHLRILRQALATNNSVGSEVFHILNKRFEEIYELGGAALGLLFFGVAELLVAIEASAPPLLEDIAIRAFSVGPAVGYATVAGEVVFFVKLLYLLFRSTRWAERDLSIFREILQAMSIAPASELRGEWQYSGTFAQHWPIERTEPAASRPARRSSA